MDTTEKKYWTAVYDYGKLPREERIQKFFEDVSSLFLRFSPDAIFFEEVVFAKGPGAWIIHRQEGILIALCADIPFVGVGVSELKKWATGGNGRAKKPEMVSFANQKASGFFGKTVSNDNEADALLVTLWGLEQLA